MAGALFKHLARGCMSNRQIHAQRRYLDITDQPFAIGIQNVKVIVRDSETASLDERVMHGVAGKALVVLTSLGKHRLARLRIGG